MGREEKRDRRRKGKGIGGRGVRRTKKSDRKGGEEKGKSK